MPTKKQIDFAGSEIKAAKKPAAKKNVAVKKKSPVKKTASATKPSVKKVSPKKVTSKKTAAKKNSPVSAIEVDQPIMFSVPSVAILENEVHHANKAVEIQRKIILVGICRNCDHMPMGVNKLVAVLSLAIAVLSGMLIYSSSPMPFRMPSISMSTLTDWVTPASHVKNL
ncbi:MAG: NAD-dependent DNA ligase LigA [Candidatus Uhrbacteria bacterium GW2011_GWF2_39_13]|uniref:NAD-dependent DNA ligase LigA n=1 Tax=Candidatus Uhrbacteria bacterium GW2011_GWF2_39_13 TaxID=1618995 RepID=A0A0G0QT91_9BACT|nr:MAG: NAD-dependent DNA ligase LigA [Candidatus Uhrbacteria bacterium GW2011_GWF2_39_13]HAU66252.1 hypothetical protein [Candidatus Uhrbacteria bacterium]HAU66300.1 hypothetical protein [Candidatus Uhrbacteria bacterium]